MSAKRARHERLLEERDDLLRSLEDLEREFAAGDIAEVDLQRLRNDYISRTATLTKRIDRLDDVEVGRSTKHTGMKGLRRRLGRSRTRRTLVAVTSVWVIAAVTLVALHFSGVRLPGQSATGSISLSQSLLVEQELTQASTFANAGNTSGAYSLYSKILSQVPDQIEALTYQGWLTRLSGVDAHNVGVVATGDAEIARAVALSPGYPDARGLDGVALAEDQNKTAEAISEFKAFLADHPSSSLLQSLASQIATIYQTAKITPPKAITAATKT
jgi:hypothetical protein